MFNDSIEKSGNVKLLAQSKELHDFIDSKGDLRVHDIEELGTEFLKFIENYHYNYKDKESERNAKANSSNVKQESRSNTKENITKELEESLKSVDLQTPVYKSRLNQVADKFEKDLNPKPSMDKQLVYQYTASLLIYIL